MDTHHPTDPHTNKIVSKYIVYAVSGLVIALMLYVGSYLALRTHDRTDEAFSLFHIFDTHYVICRTDLARHQFQEIKAHEESLGRHVGNGYLSYVDGPGGGKWTLIFLPLLKIESSLR